MGAGKIKRNNGYSLVEVMVAMVISLIVLSGVYRVITDETVNAAREEAVLDMQNNARVAMARIAGDLRRTGFFGCGGKLSADTVTGGYTYPPTSIVFTNNDAGAAGTDAITLAFLGGDVPLEPGHADTIGIATDKKFKLARKAFATGESLLITDCEEYAIFTKTNPTDDTFLLEHDTTSNTSADLKRAYGAPRPARVYNFESSAYRVDDAELKFNGQVVAENIEDLQFEFIEDTDNDGDLGDQAWQQTFADPEEVRAVRVWVLAMSDIAYSYTDNNTYDYPNSPYHSGSIPAFSTNGDGGSPASQAPLADDYEHRYRYLASAIIYLRNAGIVD